jgi:6,7-dimethyl-8-ribityllumazine synthase
MNKIAIISANYYEKVTSFLENGAIEVLKKNNLDYEILYIPGAFEIPAALNFAIKSQKYSGFLTFGCVIKGETDHYNFICDAIFNQISKIIIKNQICSGMGILTVNNLAQAMERADQTKQNVGGGAATAMIKMINLKKQLGISE